MPPSPASPSGPARAGFGLALGGGAVRGAAHVGVISVLEEEGLRPGLVTGTSVGAILGAGYAAGIPPSELLAGFRETRWLRLVTPSLRPASSLSLLDTSRLEDLLRRDFGLTTFDALEMPLGVVACDLGSGEAVLLREGGLVEAVLASSAVPGLFPPVRREDRLLVDGGIACNVPIPAALEMGADRVLAVDLLASTLEAVPDNFMEVWQFSLTHMIRAQQPRPREGDLLLVPRLETCSFTDFGQVDAIYREGRRAARETLEAIRGLAIPAE